MVVHRKEEVGKSFRLVDMCIDILRWLRAKEDDKSRLRAKGKIKYDSLYSCVKFSSAFFFLSQLFIIYVVCSDGIS